MKFIAFTKNDGQVVVVNIAHIVAMYEVGRATRIVISSGDDFHVEMPLAQAHAQIDDKLNPS